MCVAGGEELDEGESTTLKSGSDHFSVAQSLQHGVVPSSLCTSTRVTTYAASALGGGFVRVLAGGLELTSRRVSTRGAAGGTSGRRLGAERVVQEVDVASDVGRSIDC